MPEPDRLEHARQNARAAMDNIKEMVKRLKHAEECEGGDDCELMRDEIRECMVEFKAEAPMTEKQWEDEKAEYHDRDAAMEHIQEDALSVEVRSGWTTPGEKMEPEEFHILLTTGGPALQVTGDLNFDRPKNARLEMQDWGTPWTEFILTHEEYEALLEYARAFYYGD